MEYDLKAPLVFDVIYRSALAAAGREPLLRTYLEHAVLECDSLDMALARLLSAQLETAMLGREPLYDICREAFAADPDLIEQAAADLIAVCQRDPASQMDYAIPFLYLKGCQALESYRVAHWLCGSGRHDLALYLQSVISRVYGVDIHPQAVIGRGIMIDHATGVVIGQTAVVADNVSLMQAVTLGGTGKEEGDRHPKISEGVLIGAGARVLGNIRVGRCAKIGAGSVVLSDVPAHSTVVGVPARVVDSQLRGVPSQDMRQDVGLQNTFIGSEPQPCLRKT